MENNFSFTITEVFHNFFCNFIINCDTVCNFVVLILLSSTVYDTEDRGELGRLGELGQQIVIFFNKLNFLKVFFNHWKWLGWIEE